MATIVQALEWFNMLVFTVSGIASVGSAVQVVASGIGPTMSSPQTSIPFHGSSASNMQGSLVSGPSSPQGELSQEGSVDYGFDDHGTTSETNVTAVATGQNNSSEPNAKASEPRKPSVDAHPIYHDDNNLTSPSPQSFSPTTSYSSALKNSNNSQNIFSEVEEDENQGQVSSANTTILRGEAYNSTNPAALLEGDLFFSFLRILVH